MSISRELDKGRLKVSYVYKDRSSDSLIASIDTEKKQKKKTNVQIKKCRKTGLSVFLLSIQQEAMKLFIKGVSPSIFWDENSCLLTEAHS